mgnify:CR=1 FL=1
MSETVEFEIKKQFKNFLVIVKTMSSDREKSFYIAYGKDALVFGYVMKSKIRYRNFRVAKMFKKLHYFDKKAGEGQKRQNVFTAYSEVSSDKLQEIINVLDYYHINYTIVDKMQNYEITHMRQFKDNNYESYYQKGLYYKRILYKMKNINRFLRANSDSGEILYLIYDIERCIDDYRKRYKNLKNKKWKKNNETRRRKNR